MSLKTFHLIFITASCALAFGCGVWEFKNFLAPDGRGWDLVFSLAAFAAGIGLIVYERFFLKKLKGVSYL